jgi:hypothetical protein
MLDLNRLENESFIDYCERLITGKDNNIYDIDKSEIWDLLFNEKISSDEARKRLYGVKAVISKLKTEGYEDIIDEAVLEKIELKRIEFEKEKQRFFDQRTAYNKIIRDTARLDELKDIILSSVHGIKPYESYYRTDISNSENDLLVGLNDIHFGVEIDNYWNKYNSDIAKKRLEKYLSEIISVQKLHNSENCFVFANGDLISGNTHLTIALANKENVVEQVMGVSELISWFLSELSNYFNSVYFLVVAGNHSRLSLKDMSPKNERLDDLIPFYVKARLQNLHNVSVLEDHIDNTMSVIDIRGRKYLGVHGDYDNLSNILKLVEMLPDKVYSIYMGHLHHNKTDFVQGYKVLMSGSLMGVDDYCIEKRIFGKSQQLICVCDSNGVKCAYDIILN